MTVWSTNQVPEGLGLHRKTVLKIKHKLPTTISEGNVKAHFLMKSKQTECATSYKTEQYSARECSTQLNLENNPSEDQS